MKFIKRSKSSKRNDPFSISISDLMAGILMIFILALISMFFTIFYPSLGKSLVNIIKLNLDNKKGSLYNKNKLLKRF